MLSSAALGLPAPGAWAALSVEKWEAGTCKESTCNSGRERPVCRILHTGRGTSQLRNHQFRLQIQGSRSHRRQGTGRQSQGRARRPATGPGRQPRSGRAMPRSDSQRICVSRRKARSAKTKPKAPRDIILGVKDTVKESYPVFDIQRKPGEPARFGVEVNSSVIEALEGTLGLKLKSVIYLEGGISWHSEAPSSEDSGVQSGDYHEYFKIQNIPEQPEIVKSKLLFWGVPHEHEASAADNAFLTMPSSVNDCTKPQTTWLHVDSYEDPGNFIADPVETRLENGTAGLGDRLQHACVRPIALAQRRNQPVRRARRRERRPARPPDDDRTVAGQLARRADRRSDAAGRDDAQPVRGQRAAGLHERSDRDRHRQPDRLPGGFENRNGDDRRPRHSQRLARAAASTSAHSRARRRNPAKSIACSWQWKRRRTASGSAWKATSRRTRRPAS